MTTSFYTTKDGLKQDRQLHTPIIAAVQFHKSPAYKFALKRAMALGLSQAQAKKLLKKD